MTNEQCASALIEYANKSRDATTRIVELTSALDACEKVLNAHFATPYTTEGRRALAAVNLARKALHE